MDKIYLISWRADIDRKGKAIVLDSSPIQAWEKFINKWNENFESGEVDLNPNKIKSFLVERGADEFIK